VTRKDPLFADYVVIGAGSSGCVVANRLSENPSCTVLVVEAGGWDTRQEIHEVSLASTLALWNADWHTSIDWGYETAPQEHLAGRRIPIARGKVVGGCGSINALMWVRGNPGDYRRWAESGAKGWSFDEVLPYFQRCENYLGSPSNWRGLAGPITIWEHANLTPVARAFLHATRELGYGATDRDYNGPVQEGFGFPYQANRTRSGSRCSTATGYLHPILDRTNLAVLTCAQATRLVFRDDKVAEVEYLEDGQLQSVVVGEGVVVCGGTFETPKLLMLSGIGPAAQLKAHDLNCRHDSPAVGQNLQDHLFLGVVYASKLANPEAELISEVGLFARTAVQDAFSPPGLQMTFGTGKFLPLNSAPDHASGPGFTFGPVLIQPKSRGQVRLASADPRHNTEVQPCYLSDPADADVLVEGIELARRLAHSTAFAEFRGAELAPGARLTTGRELRGFVASAATTIWHPVGTCRMGSDDNSVVDSTLRVRGTENVWVADASVMPSITAGNTHAPSVMIGERAAEFIKETRETHATH
jgi:choline dehydrogenase